MARLLRVSQMAVSRWSRGITDLPGEHVLQIEAHTGVSKHDLRPDLYPREGGAPADQDRPSDMVPAR